MTIPNDLLITIWKEEVVPWLLRPWQRLKIIIFKSLNRVSNRTWLAGLDSHNLSFWYKNGLRVIYWVNGIFLKQMTYFDQPPIFINLKRGQQCCLHVVHLKRSMTLFYQTHTHDIEFNGQININWIISCYQ